MFEDEKTKKAVLEDLDFVKRNGINSVPALIVEGKYLISGAQPQETIEKTLEEIAEKEDLKLNSGFQMMGDDAGACRVVDGQWKCD